MTKRVALVGPAYPYRGGIAHFTSVLASQFAHDSEVLLVNFTRLYPSLFFPGSSQYDMSSSPLTAESRRIIDSINPLSYWRAARALAAFNPDVVVFQWWHPFFAPAYASIRLCLPQRLRGRAVYLCHNVMPHECSPVDRIFIRLGFAGVRRFLVQSREDRDRLLRLKPGVRVAVQPHPIYDVFRRGGTREEAREMLGLEGDVVLFFGLIRPYKGLGHLLDAFARLIRRRAATLMIVGEFYEDPAPYRAHLEELGIENRVKLVARYVPDEEVERYFLASDLVVLPYLSATQSGIVQIAYAFEKPVVVTRVGGLPDVVEEGRTGYVVPPADPDALCDAMEAFFAAADREAMSAAVGRAQERFSWERCSRTLLDLAGSDAH